MAADHRATLRRLLELAEQETTLIDRIDAEGMMALCAERAGLLAALPPRAELGPDCDALIARVLARSAENEATASFLSGEIRGRLRHIARGRKALDGYSPTVNRVGERRLVTIDREG